jgi:flagellar biogenesis protein FliO
MYEVEKNWLDIGVKRVEQLHNFLMQLKAKEAEENQKEWNIDIRLDKVLASLQ